VAWLGLLVVVVGFGGYFVAASELALFQMIPWPFLAVMAVGLAVALGALVRRPRVGSGLAAVLAVGVAGFAGWYLFSYSIFDARETRPAVGDRLPTFPALPTSTGGTFRLEDARGSYLLLLFYRGSWCPFCVAELGELRRSYQAILDRGVRLVAVSVDAPETSEALRQRLDFDIDFVSDTRGTLFDVLNVRDRGGAPPQVITGAPPGASRDIFLPTTFLVDGEGVIRWVHRPRSYRVRASVADVLAAIDAAQGAS
jgi:peroxiredoxin